jgi:hypothetical protein
MQQDDRTGAQTALDVGQLPVDAVRLPVVSGGRPHQGMHARCPARHDGLGVLFAIRRAKPVDLAAHNSFDVLSTSPEGAELLTQASSTHVDVLIPVKSHLVPFGGNPPSQSRVLTHLVGHQEKCGVDALVTKNVEYPRR